MSNNATEILHFDIDWFLRPKAISDLLNKFSSLVGFLLGKQQLFFK